jgi:hypothetical protein
MFDLQHIFVLLAQEPKQRPVSDGVTDNTAILQAWAEYRRNRQYPMWVMIWPVPTYVLRYVI